MGVTFYKVLVYKNVLFISISYSMRNIVNTWVLFTVYGEFFNKWLKSVIRKAAQVAFV